MINKYVSRLKKDGFIIIENIFNKKQTTVVKKKLDIILKNRIKKKLIVGDEDNQIMYNYFFDDKSLLKLLYIPLVDKILKKVLDINYVLSLGNAQNRILNLYNIKKKKKITKLEQRGTQTADI